MPIYAYRCEACGFAKDVLQKIADAPLSACPSCDKPTFKKQLTAAGFQLKGSGWYATDFRGGSTPASSGDKAAAGDGAASTEAKSSGADTKSAGADAKAASSDAKSTTT